MTVREFLQNNNVSLDSEIFIRLSNYDVDNNEYCQDFPISIITVENNCILLESFPLNKYEADWLM